LLVPVMILLAVRSTERRQDRRVLIAIGLAVTCAVGTMLPLIFGGRQLSLAYEQYSPYFFGTLAFFAIQVYAAATFEPQRSAGDLGA
jgi:hypothetical protein